VADGQKLKVFISYSRKDSSDFADELVAGLELAGFAPFLDRHDIAAGEDWETRLGGLIQAADAVVYVISPEAVKSERCSWEVDKTLALSKRLIPVIFKPVAENAIPDRLRRLQFIRFDQGLGITRPLAQLAEALRQDLDWIREHTRFAELAARWQARGCPSSMLLRGDDLSTARTWAAKRKPEAPEITESQTAFLNASIAESRIVRRRQLLVQAAFGTLAAVVIAGVAAYWNEQSLRAGYYWLALVRGHVLTAQKERLLKPGETFSECVKTNGDYSKYCPEMVVIPAGKFMMGSPSTEKDREKDEGPQHEVTIARPFAISKFEVTFDHWDTCVQYGGCMRWRLVGASFGGGKQPAINVSWDDAKEYVNWLSWLTGEPYRLLTEAEWEYAARAGSTGPYSFEGDASLLGEYAWYSENSGDHTHPVGEKKPNAFGLYDVHGNVFEWVEDCYHNSYDGSPRDGTAWIEGDCSSRVVRGGAWSGGPQDLRSANRGGITSDEGYVALGFRVGRTLSAGADAITVAPGAH
jgi:formylglycine-generating enzyme required for sulfatase activity